MASIFCGSGIIPVQVMCDVVAEKIKAASPELTLGDVYD